jgi:hypothetical protein
VTEPNATTENQSSRHRKVAGGRKHFYFITYVGIAIGAAVAIAAALLVGFRAPSAPTRSTHSTQPMPYLGVYEPDAPHSYADIDQFAQAIGRQPNLVSYYSYWLEPFQAEFAASAAKRGAVMLVQIDARSISLASIANGQYDKYLQSYANAVKAFGAQVILSFGHEMNGNWYSWGYHRTPAATFVAAWRHIVTIFRKEGTKNVTWLWTVNIIDTVNNHIPNPVSWWPGSSYVNWVGIDGYYYSPSMSFASLFGPTIADVREVTHDPILISETGSTHSAGQPAKIIDLFSGVRAYGLLGFVWFDRNGEKQIQDWRINSSDAVAAFRRAAKVNMKPAS